jgi:phosphotriesterase-related protein
VQTVLGLLDPSDLGVCYGHEHLLGAPPLDVSDNPDFVLDDEEAAADELLRFRRAGGSTVVEMSTADYGRDAAGLRRLSRRTGVHVICATGYNKDVFSARIVEGASVDVLANRFTAEILEGIDDTGIRAGLVKASSTLDQISPLAARVFRAAAAAHHRTGAPISTHTEAGTMALEQARLLAAEGVDLRHLIIGHMDRKLDREYHLDVVSTGCFVGFDQISKTKYYTDIQRAETIAWLVDRGFGRQILLGGDLARRSYWPGYGFTDAPGLEYILRHFVGLLRDVGLSAGQTNDLLVNNPARAFAFRVDGGDVLASQPRRQLG